MLKSNSTRDGHDWLYAVLQTALLETVHSMVDGPVSGRALKIVAVELRGKLAAILRLRMVAGLV